MRRIRAEFVRIELAKVGRVQSALTPLVVRFRVAGTRRSSSDSSLRCVRFVIDISTSE